MFDAFTKAPQEIPTSSARKVRMLFSCPALEEPGKGNGLNGSFAKLSCADSYKQGPSSSSSGMRPEVESSLSCSASSSHMDALSAVSMLSFECSDGYLHRWSAESPACIVTGARPDMELNSCMAALLAGPLGNQDAM